LRDFKAHKVSLVCGTSHWIITGWILLGQMFSVAPPFSGYSPNQNRTQYKKKDQKLGALITSYLWGTGVANLVIQAHFIV